MKLSKEQLLLILDALYCYKMEFSKCPDEYNSTIKNICDELFEEYNYTVKVKKDSLGYFNTFIGYDPDLISLFELKQNISEMLKDIYEKKILYTIISDDILYKIKSDLQIIEDKIQSIMQNNIQFSIKLDGINDRNELNINIDFIDKTTGKHIINNDELDNSYFVDKKSFKNALSEISMLLLIKK